MAEINAVTDLSRDGDVAIVTVDSPPVNALSTPVRAGIRQAVAQAGADPEVKAVVLICAGRTFIAGADISEFGKPPQEPSLAEVQDTIEALGKPVVAAVHGTALGGGFEVALACHARVAVPSARFGLPEVKLGFLPGAGGTQRLPRLVGAGKALEMIVSGAPMGAGEALEAGVVDELAEEGALRDGAVAYARRLAAGGAMPAKVRDRTDRIEADRGNEEIFSDALKAHARKFRGTKQLDHIVAAVRAAVELPFDEGLALERKLFVELMKSDEAAAMRYVFFAERQVWKIPDVPADTETLPVASVGIVGAGTMGGGIAMNFLNAGIPVTIVEAKKDALERGLRIIRRNYERSAKRGRLSADDVEARLKLLTPTLALDDLADCDLVIEAVFEEMEVKKEVFAKLDGIVKQGAILATNTSYLDVDQIAAMTGRPEHVLGLHFFSPANVMRLLEVVRGAKTEKRILATVMQLARKIGKIAVMVGVCHGFVGNRMLAQRQREANKLILEGAMPWDVDRVIYDFGLPMGPFGMADLAGLDLGWSRETSKGETVSEILCDMDRRGQKTSAGYYDYDENRRASPSEATEKVILQVSERLGVKRREVSSDEILKRCIYPMINEGAKILEEGVAIRASDIDVVWINGYGWPAYRGGPMYYADSVGLDEVLKTMKRFEEMYGADFKPAPLLERLVAEGKRFRDL